jgi:hypothetical protein
VVTPSLPASGASPVAFRFEEQGGDGDGQD